MGFKNDDTITRVLASLICFTLFIYIFLVITADVFQTSLSRFLQLV